MDMEQDHENTSLPCRPSYNVFLHCTTTEQSEQKVVSFDNTPLNVLDVKRQIEKRFSIPVCVQVILYNSCILKDDTILIALSIRDGDTFHVKYLEKGHCSEVVETVAWMRLVLAGIQRENPSATVGMSWELNNLVTRGIRNEMIESLAFKYFYPWLDPVKYVNKLHFAHHGGVQILMELHAALLQKKWQERLMILQLVEFYLLRVIWNFSETFPLCRAITKNKGIERCIQSMLHYKLEEGSRFEYLVSNDSFEGALLRDTIIGGLGVLCNLSELPECHIEIASNEDALEQMTMIGASPYLPIDCSHHVATIFLCLAHTPGTHGKISKPKYLTKLLDAFSIERHLDADQLDADRIPDCSHPLLRYFVLLFLAQVALVSPQCIPTDIHVAIIEEMMSLLQFTCYEIIRSGELTQNYVWCTFIPYIKLAYIPNTPHINNPACILQVWSLEIIIFALQNMLGRENHREFIVKEGLLDFVTCMPQYVPPSLKSRATKLVQMVASSPDVPEGPPKLLNLVKARLAKMHFGLENVLSMSVSEIVSHAFATHF